MIISIADGAAQTQRNEQCKNFHADYSREYGQNICQILLEYVEQFFGASLGIHNVACDSRCTHINFKCGTQCFGSCVSTACAWHLEKLPRFRQIQIDAAYDCTVIIEFAVFPVEWTIGTAALELLKAKKKNQN